MKRKDLLGLRGVERAEIEEILDTAATLHAIVDSPTKKTPHLNGKSIITLFYENSTRTRMSFELASKYMSGVAANIAASSSSVQKGETLIDTGRTLDRMGTDVLIMRHPMSGAPHLLARHIKAAVINAGDGTNEHPTQALLDMYTMRRRKGGVKGLRVAIVGDVMHSRVARSNVFGLQTMGADVILAGAPTLLPVSRDGVADGLGVRVTDDVDEAVRGADVVMGLRIQLERQERGLFPSAREYIARFGLTPERVALAAPDALVMHPGPMNRGVDISSIVADCEQSVIDEQVTSGVVVRMALLYMMSRKGA